MTSTPSPAMASPPSQGPFTSPFNSSIGYGRLVLVVTGIGLSVALPAGIFTLLAALLLVPATEPNRGRFAARLDEWLLLYLPVALSAFLAALHADGRTGGVPGAALALSPLWLGVTRAWPCRAAQSSGVQPASSVLEAEAPAPSRCSADVASPYMHAYASGVRPSHRVWSGSAFASSSSLTVSV